MIKCVGGVVELSCIYRPQTRSQYRSVTTVMTKVLCPTRKQTAIPICNARNAMRR